MKKGKVAAQVGHAVLKAYKKSIKYHNPYLAMWDTVGSAKITLNCPSLEELRKLEKDALAAGLICGKIVDAGRTQIASGSVTVLAIGPAPVTKINTITGHLSLY